MMTSMDAFAPILSHRRAIFHHASCHSMTTASTSASYSSSPSCSSMNGWVMKLHSQGGSSRDSILSERNRERVATAGRRGTKRFVDPGKVFVGGLPFDATEEDLKAFFGQHMGPNSTRNNIHSVKIIRDWKTKQSKGYGFVIFTDPMFATCAMEFCKNKKLNGRILTLDQGKKKIDPNTLYVKKNKKPALDEEEAAIQAGMDGAEEGRDVDVLDTADTDAPAQDDEEWSVEDFDDDDDAILFAEEMMEGDEDFEYDGVFEDLYPVIKEPLTEEEMALNREQRREVQKRKPRKKPPSKGFGVSN